MTHGLRKINAGIMKSDALADYNYVKGVCESANLPIVKPNGKSASKIEDATAKMLKAVPASIQLVLLKGITYYTSLNK